MGAIKKINEESSIVQLVHSCMIDFTVEVSEPPSILTLDDIPMLTYGNFSVILGGPKVRKTYFLSLLVSELFGANSCDRFDSKLGSKQVLYFDTEQAKYHTQRACKRVLTLNNCIGYLDGFKAYCLRSLPIKDRLKVIEHEIANTSNLGFVVIDGIADLVTSYNDEDQASLISNKLLQWSGKYDIHIITVLHTNKNDSNAKGHLGSYLMQKAETVLEARKTVNSPLTEVKSKFSRGIEIKPISFKVNDDGLPVVSVPPQPKRKESIDKPSSYDLDFHKKLIDEVFKDQEPIQRQEYLMKLNTALTVQNITIGDNKRQEWLKHHKDKKLIFQKVDKGPYFKA